MSTPDTWPFEVQTSDLQVAFDYDSHGNLIYQGWVQAGTAKSSTGWRIKRQIFNSSNLITDILWPMASTAFNFVWDLRTTYDYGLGAGTTVYPAFVLTSPNTTRWAITVNTIGDLISTPQASGPAGAYDIGSLVLEDSASVFWNVTISNTGDLITTAGGSPVFALTSISLFDPNGRVWVVTVLPVTGNLVTT